MASIYSPGVLPSTARRQARMGLGEQLAQALEGYEDARFRGRQEARTDRQDKAQQRYRDETLDLDRQRQERIEASEAAQRDRQRATDAANGLIYDPEDTYGRANFTAPTGVPGMQGQRVDVRRPGVTRLPGNYTMDAHLTPDGRAASREQAEAERLARLLEAAGLKPGIARAGAAMPGALPYIQPRAERPFDPATDPVIQRDQYFRRTGGGRYFDDGRRRGAGGGGEGALGENDDFYTVPGLSVLDATRVTQDYDRETGQVNELADALSTDAFRDPKAATRADSLRGVATTRVQQRPRLADLTRDRSFMTGVSSGSSSTSAPRPSRKVRWEQLVDGGMSEDEATAQVRREYGMGGR